MPTLLSARSRRTSGGAGAGGGDDDGAGAGNRACYGIAACAVSLLLLYTLAASVSVWMAFAFGVLALVAFGVAGCLAPASWRVGPSDGGGASAESDAAAAAGAAGAAARARRRFRMPKAAIDALPTFAYELHGGEATVVVGGDLESGAAAGGEQLQCPVCLEDVEAGEMVRQLPACKHLFHAGCIDMWLHSHRTCPVCRCNLLRSQRKVAAVKAAAAAAAAEEDLPAEDASPPV